MKVKKILAGLVGLSMLAFSVPALADLAPPQGFDDISPTNPNYTAIMELKARGIIGGYSDGTFKPDQTVNRAEALKIILLGSGIEVPESETAPFKDISKTAWYTKYVVKAKELNIVQGYPDGTFKGEKTVNLVENLKMLIKAKGIVFNDSMVATDPYPDAPKNQWYAIYLEYAKMKNLIDVDTNGNIHPDQGMTRGNLAQAMYRLIYIQENDLSTFPKFPGNTFNFSDIKVGDQVAGMKITAIEKKNPENALAVNNVKISFEGEITLEGNYRYESGEICMIGLEGSSLDKLPTLIAGDTSSVICFNNKSLASDFFAPAESNGTAVVTIDHYTVISGGPQLYNTADFVKLISKTPTPKPQPGTQINIMDMSFLSGSPTITVGTTVTWTNKDQAAHTVTSDNDGSPLNSQTINNSQTYSFTFTQAGSYNYHCAFHPNMKGTIVVIPVAIP